MKKVIELCDNCEDELEDESNAKTCIKCNERKLCEDCHKESENGYITTKNNLVCGLCIEKLIKKGE